MVALSIWPLASYTQALTYPGNASFAVRTVEWVRDNGGGGLVDLPVDGQGAFVLDRDGPSFRFILNYLRDRIEAAMQADTGAANGAPVISSAGWTALQAICT